MHKELPLGCRGVDRCPDCQKEGAKDKLEIEYLENAEKQRSHPIGECEVSWRCGRYGAIMVRYIF